jgi:hypothetical protein
LIYSSSGDRLNFMKKHFFTLSFLYLLVMAAACSEAHTTNIASIDGKTQAITNSVVHIASGLDQSDLQMSRNEDGWYEASFPVLAGRRVTLSVRANADTSLLLWSGTSRLLTSWPAVDGGARPFPVAFTPSVNGNGTFRFDPQSLRYTLSPSSLIKAENTRTNFSLLSDAFLPESMEPSQPANRMQRLDATTWQIVLSNLIPGRRVTFAFAANLSQHELLLASHVSPANQVLDAGLSFSAPGWQSVWLNHVPLSEELVISLDYSIPTWNISSLSTGPHFGDGYDDPTYGSYRMHATNLAWGLRSIAARPTPLAWYFLLDASFASPAATLPADRGLASVILLDDPTDFSGQTGSLVVRGGLSPVVLPAGISVEYVIIMQAATPQSGYEGIAATQVTVYGPLTDGDPFPATGHSLTSLESVQQNGYYTYGNRYELVIPRYSTSGTPILPSSSLKMTAIGWNAGTAWGDMSNTNLQYPIAEAIPWGSSNATLATSNLWLSVP